MQLRAARRVLELQSSERGADTGLVSDVMPTEARIYISRAGGDRDEVDGDVEDIFSDDVPDETPFDVRDYPAYLAVIEFIEKLDHLRENEHRRQLQRRVVPVVLGYAGVAEVVGIIIYIVHPDWNLGAYSAGVLGPVLGFAGTVVGYLFFKRRRR